MLNILPFLHPDIAQYISTHPGAGKLTEIRLRNSQPIALHIGRRVQLLPHKATPQHIHQTMEKISQHSIYAFQQELTQGYITLPGGHRVGVVGQAVIEAGRIKSWRYISSINIRIAREIVGCAAPYLPSIMGESLRHSLIISPPGAGKTTVLRDIVRSLSHQSYTVGLVDERGEIAACHQGIPQHDVGPHTDIIEGAPKHIAMEILLRTMSPKVIAVDELGTKEDMAMLEKISTAGITLICTAHGSDPAKMQIPHFFENIIMLK